MKKKEYLWLSMTILTLTLTVPSITPAQERWRDDDRRDWRQDQRRDEYRERWADERREEYWERRGNRLEGRGRLIGRWYKDGDACEIVPTRDGFEARNERGDTSRLAFERDGDLRALDWGNLHGEVRGNRIVWENGTSWRR